MRSDTQKNFKAIHILFIVDSKLFTNEDDDIETHNETTGMNPATESQFHV